MFIDENQIARRNLTRQAFKLALGRRYNRTKTVGHGSGSAGQIDPQNTAARLADKHDVSAATVKRAGKFAEKVEELTKGVEATVATDKGKKKKRAKVTAKAAKAFVGEKNTVKLLEETALALEKDGTDNPSVDLLFKLVKALKKQPTVETLKALFE